MLLHHGDAVGADADAHQIATEHGVEIHVHPGPDPAHRAFCTGAVVHAPKEFMARNKDVVDGSDYLVAAPAVPEAEARQSGTWRTVRYARAAKVPITIIWPDGTVEVEGGDR